MQLTIYTTKLTALYRHQKPLRIQLRNQILTLNQLGNLKRNGGDKKLKMDTDFTTTICMESQYSNSLIFRDII